MNTERQELRKIHHPEVFDLGEKEFDRLNNELCLATAYHTCAVKRAGDVVLVDEASGVNPSDKVIKTLAFGEDRAWMVVRSKLSRSVRERIIRESPKAAELGDDFMVWAGLSADDKKRVEAAIETIVEDDIPYRSIVNMPGQKEEWEQKVSVARGTLEAVGLEGVFLTAQNERDLEDCYARHFVPKKVGRNKQGLWSRAYGFVTGR